jgi:aspartate kinase
MEPAAKGTTISSEVSSKGAKAVAAKDGITAVKIKSSRMLLAYGFLRKVFEIFEKYKTSIDMVTTSEVAVSVTIDNNGALPAIKKELETLGHVDIDKDQTIISIVGNEIASDATSLQKVFGSLGGINVRMVSYGGSDNNISLLVPADQKKQVLQQLNSGVFGL